MAFRNSSADGLSSGSWLKALVTRALNLSDRFATPSGSDWLAIIIDISPASTKHFSPSLNSSVVIIANAHISTEACLRFLRCLKTSGAMYDSVPGPRDGVVTVVASVATCAACRLTRAIEKSVIFTCFSWVTYKKKFVNT